MLVSHLITHYRNNYKEFIHMARKLPFDPKQLREKQTIKIPSIPDNQYKSDIKKELKLYDKNRLI